MDLANDLAVAYAKADMVDDPDGWVDALRQELGVPQDADEQQSEDKEFFNKIDDLGIGV